MKFFGLVTQWTTIYQWKSTRQLCTTIFLRNTFNVFLAKIITKTTNSPRSWGHGAQRCAAILFYHKLSGNCSNCLSFARWWIPVVCCHLVTLSPCHLVTLSPCHLVFCQVVDPCGLLSPWWTSWRPASQTSPRGNVCDHDVDLLQGNRGIWMDTYLFVESFW